MAQGFEHWNERMVEAKNAKVARGGKKASPSPIKPAVNAAPVQESFDMDRERKSFTLVLPWPVSDNHYLGNRIVIPKDPTKKPFVHHYHTEEAKQFIARVRAVAKASGVPMLIGDLLVVMRLFRPTKVGDTSNRIKVGIDAMQGICFENDKQISRLEIERFDDKENPRLEVIIQERY